MNKKPLIILTGPTAVGKTHLSLDLARAVGGEIISADSMQVYRHMDIGSAKIKPADMQGINHYLIDVLEPEEDFNVVRFKQMAKQAMDTIYSHGNIPILTGGTGFYIQAVVKDVDFTASSEENETDEKNALRMKLEEYAKTNGAHALHNKLMAVDPVSAKAIHENNIKRVIRALEYYEQTGECISSHNASQKQKKSAYNSVYFVLSQKRDILYRKIDERVDEMLANGLLDEVKYLKDRGCTSHMVSMQGLGYKELLAYLDGKMNYNEAVSLIKQNTRHFAKRQLTWFRREKEAIWFDKSDYPGEDKILQDMLAIFKQSQGELK